MALTFIESILKQSGLLKVTIRSSDQFLRVLVFDDAHHFDHVQCLREDFHVVDERQLLRGVDGSPDLHVDRSVADEERHEVEQFSIADELIREHDRRP